MDIYLDNSSTTKPYPQVVNKMVQALEVDYANPSAAHSKGVEVEKEIKNIRQTIARSVGANDKEIYFTSGGFYEKVNNVDSTFICNVWCNSFSSYTYRI